MLLLRPTSEMCEFSILCCCSDKASNLKQLQPLFLLSIHLPIVKNQSFCLWDGRKKVKNSHHKFPKSSKWRLQIACFVQTNCLLLYRSKKSSKSSLKLEKGLKEQINYQIIANYLFCWKHPPEPNSWLDIVMHTKLFSDIL